MQEFRHCMQNNILWKSKILTEMECMINMKTKKKKNKTKKSDKKIINIKDQNGNHCKL